MAVTIPDRITPETLARLHADLVAIARRGGEIAMNYYRAGADTRARIEWKPGGSPVTEADHAVDSYLAMALPGALALPVHTEERRDSWRGAEGAAFVIDPIDGTRDFIAGGHAWCIVIGVVEAGIPIGGVVHLPASGHVFSAYRGGGAWLDEARLHAPASHRGPLTATGPRVALDAMAKRLGEPIHAASPVPALAHRMLAPLSGHADIALARAGGHDWDIAAADCILREAGAVLLTQDGDAPAYRLRGGEQPPLIAAPMAILDKIRPALLTDRA